MILKARLFFTPICYRVVLPPLIPFRVTPLRRFAPSCRLAADPPCSFVELFLQCFVAVSLHRLTCFADLIGRYCFFFFLPFIMGSSSAELCESSGSPLDASLGASSPFEDSPTLLAASSPDEDSS
ncbi:uncharacterized protein G2W53_041795 [Senna tora]|uniref:Uncharacterized protein n=1 Tax=Senna tora TaxID=362788 RepID=A0A834W379_9FABA|nr:uncharacterized protein G2W53_041795 [Senna tora]